MKDQRHMGATPTEQKASATERVRGFLFGHDLFISYSRADAGKYAKRLANQLAKKGLVCYIDHLDTHAGSDVPDKVLRAASRSTRFVVVGTENAIKSDGVKEEIEVFNGTSRQILPINVDGALLHAPWYELIHGLPFLPETREAVVNGRPSREVLRGIYDAAKFTKRTKKLNRVFWVTFGAIVLLAVVGVGIGNVLVSRALAADQQRQEAESRLVVAEKKSAEAEYSRGIAEASAQTAQHDAEKANVQREKAETAARTAADQAKKAKVSELAARANANAALRQEQEAKRSTRKSTAERLAVESLRNKDDYPQRAILLSLAAVDVTARAKDPPVFAAEESLRRVLASAGGEIFSGYGGVESDRESFANRSITFSPDGGWFISKGAQDFELWEVRSNLPPRLVVQKRNEEERQPRAFNTAFSADSRWFAATTDGDLYLWNLKLQPLKPVHKKLSGRMFEEDMVGFSSNGRWLVLGGFHPPALYDLTSEDLVPQEVARPKADVAATPGDASGAAAKPWRRLNSPKTRTFLSDDNRWLIHEDWGHTTRVYDLLSKNPVTPTLVAPNAAFIAVSSHGRWLATGNAETTIQVWGLMSQATNRGPYTLHRVNADYPDVVFSPDEQWLVATDETKGVKLWNLAAPSPRSYSLSETDGYFKDYGGFIEFVFSPDSHWLSTLRRDVVDVKFWDLTVPDPSKTSPDLIGETCDKEFGVRSVIFSPDGRWLVAVGQNNRAALTQLARDGSRAKQFNLRAEGILHDVVFSPDNRWLAAGANKTIELWDLTARNPTSDPTTLKGSDDLIHELVFSPDSRRIVASFFDGVPRGWDLRNIRSAAQPITFKHEKGNVDNYEVSPDGRWLVTTSEDAAKLWSLESDIESAKPFELSGGGKGRNPITDRMFSSDGRWLITSEKGRVLLTNLRPNSPGPHQRVLEGPNRIAVFSPNSRYLAAYDDHGGTRVWKLNVDGSWPTSYFDLPGRTGYPLVFSNDSNWLVTKGSAGTVLVWDLSAGGKGSEIGNGIESLESVVFSPDSKRLVTLSENVGQSQLWDLQPGAATPIKRQSLEGQLNRAIFSSDNRWLLTRGPEELSLWNLGSTMRAMIPIKLVDRLSDNKNVAYHKTEFSPDGHWLVVFAPYGNRPPTLFSLRGDLVTSEELTIAGSKVYFSAGLFSPDSRWLLCRRDVSYADTAAAFKLTPGKVRAYPIDSYVEDRKSFSPDGHWLAIKGLGSNVQLWDLTSKDPFSRAVALEDFDLDFSDPWSANGRWIVGKEAGGNGDEIKLFDLRESLPHAFVFSGKTNTLHFTPDERYLIGWNYDGVAFWSLNLSDLVELAKKTVGRSLTEREKNQYLLTDFGLKDLPR